MPRIKSPRFLSHTDRKWITTEVYEANPIWVVTYQGKIISVAISNKLTNDNPKYEFIITAQKSKAERKAKELNQLFSTQEFKATLLSEV